MKKNSKIHNNRIIFLLILFLCICILIFARLFYLQIIKRSELTKNAIEQINRSEEIVSDRGFILDRTGKRLAINTSASTIFFNGSADIDKESRKIIAKELAPLLEEDEIKLYNSMTVDKRVKLKQWVDSNVALEIREKNLSGIEVVDGFRRTYPYGNLASHLIGFTNIDGVGQYGVEASYNKDLTGSPGRAFRSSDRNNRQLPTGESQIFDASDGLSAVLTIDQGIQKFIEDETKKIITEYAADKVYVIVQEVETGHILGMSSYPSFDGNNPTKAISDVQEASWLTKSSEEIQNDWYDNWRNPVISNIFEPGSTFKLITAAAALEESTSNPNKQYYCTGYIRDIKNAPVLRCVSYENPHGDITLTDALAKSCNPTFVYVNRELGRESFLKYVKAFGFGEKTGIDLTGEASGLIPSKSEDISELGLATMSYGQGIAATPIQLVNAISAIGNDGVLMTPRVVKELVNANNQPVSKTEIAEKRQVISKETSEKMLQMMYNVVENGTATKAKSSLYKIGGKTGTANKVLSDGTGYYQDQYVSSFVGLAPIDDPKITVLVIVDNPKSETYGSIVAAPSAKNIIEYSLETLGVAKMPREVSGEYSDLVKVPDLTYKFIGDAGLLLNSLGIQYTTGYGNITDETLVVGQKPEAGEYIEKNEIVELKLDNNEGLTKIVPKLLGKDEGQIAEHLEKLGLKYEIDGLEGGVIVEQSPKAGEKISTTESLKLILGEKVENVEDNLSSPSLRDGLLEIENVENKKVIKSIDIDTKDKKEDSNNSKEEIKEENNSKQKEVNINLNKKKD